MLIFLEILYSVFQTIKTGKCMHLKKFKLKFDLIIPVYISTWNKDVLSMDEILNNWVGAMQKLYFLNFIENWSLK